MVFIDVISPAGKRTVAFPFAELSIGSSNNCDLQLDHKDVIAHHATVIERGGHAVVLDLGTLTIIDGTPIKEATVLTEESELVIGPFKLRIRHVELAPDTVQTQTIRQPGSPPIPMSEADIEILSATPAAPPAARRIPTGAMPSSAYMDVHSSEVIISPMTKHSASDPPKVVSSPIDLISSRKSAVRPQPTTTSSVAPITPVVDTSMLVSKMDSSSVDTTAAENAETDPSIPVAQAFPLPLEFEASLTERNPVKSLLRASDDPVEVGFLRAILQDPDPSDARRVYADWLENRGAVARAEYMRLLDSLIDKTEPMDPDDLEPVRLRMLGAQIATPWRAVVAHRNTPVEHCGLKRQFGADVPMGASCPGEWGKLIRGTVDDMRRCGTCARFVHYVTDVDAARRAASRGDAIVVDPAVRRSNEDLDKLPASSHYVIALSPRRSK